MCTMIGSYCENEKKREKSRGRGDVYKEWKCQGRCEWRSEGFVKIQFFFFWGGSGGGGGGGGHGGCELRSEAIGKINFFFFLGGGGGGGGGWGGRVGLGGGVRMNVNGEVKLL